MKHFIDDDSYYMDDIWVNETGQNGEEQVGQLLYLL